MLMDVASPLDHSLIDRCSLAIDVGVPGRACLCSGCRGIQKQSDYNEMAHGELCCEGEVVKFVRAQYNHES